MSPLAPNEYESRPLPPEQEKAAIRIAQLPSLVAFNLIPGLNFFLLDARLYYVARQQSSVSQSDLEARKTARSVADTETLIGFLVWLAVWITVALLKPKWWYVAVGFALAVAGAVWISSL